MRVLVAGGSGLVGSAIVAALREQAHDVGILSRNDPKQGGVTWVKGNVTEPGTLENALNGWDVVVDAVQFPNAPIENPSKGHTFERVDLGGTRNLVDAARKEGVTHFINLSGVGADPDGKFHWFRFKWAEEQYIIQSGVPYTTFRPSWIYGPDDVSLNRFLGFARFLPFVPIVGNGKARINPVFVKDVAAFVSDAVARGPANRIFEIGGPKVMTMDEIVRAGLKATGRRRFLLHQPAWFMKIVASIIQHVPGRPLTPGAVDFITADAIADVAPTVAYYDRQVTPLEDALATYLSS